MSEPKVEQQEVTFVNENLFFALGALQVILFTLTTATFALLVYILIYYSPKQLNVYKWYIIINSAFGFVFEGCITFLHPYPFLPYPILTAHGLADVYINVLGKPPQILIDIIMNLAIISIAGIIFSTMWLFIYRFLQTTQSPYLYLMANGKWPALSYLLVAIIDIFFVFIPLNTQMLSNEELIERMRKTDPRVYERMKDYVSVGFSVEDGHYYLFAGVVLVILLMVFSIVILFCAIFCYRYLRKNEHLLSPKTAKLFRSLINMLMIDLIFAGITGFLSLVTSLLSFVTKLSFGSYTVVLALSLGGLYPLLSHLLVLIYIEPYRVAAIKILHLNGFFERRSGIRWDLPTTQIYCQNSPGVACRAVFSRQINLKLKANMRFKMSGNK